MVYKAEYEPAHTCDVSEMWDSHFSDSGEAKLLITTLQWMRIEFIRDHTIFLQTLDNYNAGATITDEEVLEACRKAALKTNFNYDSDRRDMQQGSITFTITKK